MYLTHFGLKEHPFKITPDLDFFYHQSTRDASLKTLKFAIEKGDGIVKVVGDVGAGKTTLLRLLEASLPQVYFTIALLSPNLSSKDLLFYLCEQLDIKTDIELSKQQLLSLIESRLVNLVEGGQRVLLLIDESQVISLDVLEELRLISNMETGKTKLLQLVLFGQPELDITLKAKSAEPFVSRISYQIYLDAFSSKDVLHYINHRMQVAGYPNAHFFEKSDAKQIHKLSGGLPRMINKVCDKLLISAFASGRNRIASEDFKQFSGVKGKTLSGFYFLLFLGILGVGFMLFVSVFKHSDEFSWHLFTFSEPIQDSVNPPQQPQKLQYRVEQRPGTEVATHAFVPKANKSGDTNTLDVNPNPTEVLRIQKVLEFTNEVVPKLPKTFYTTLLYFGEVGQLEDVIKGQPLLQKLLTQPRVFMLKGKYKFVIFYGYSNQEQIAQQLMRSMPLLHAWPLARVVTFNSIYAIIE